MGSTLLERDRACLVWREINWRRSMYSSDTIRQNDARARNRFAHFHVRDAGGDFLDHA